MSDQVPFGKYKGKPISDLVNDKKYFDWCKGQADLVKRYPMLLTISSTHNDNNDKNDNDNNDEKDKNNEEEVDEDQPVHRHRRLLQKKLSSSSSSSSPSSEDKWEEKYKKLEELYIKLEARVAALENIE